MKALTVRQPWANLIISGTKDVENRTWKTNYRGSIYIHAAQQTGHGKEPIVRFLYPYWKHIPQENKRELIDELYFKAAIIGEIELVDCVQNHPSVWADNGVWNWVLANPIKYDFPILNVKGGLSLWQYSN